MSDRALVQFVKVNDDRKVEDFSPVVYVHWRGSEMPEMIKRIKKHMGDRSWDISYTCARFIGLIHELDSEHGNVLGLGVWNVEKVITKEDSHGDAGCALVKIYPDNNFFIEYFGGYLSDEA